MEEATRKVTTRETRVVNEPDTYVEKHRGGDKPYLVAYQIMDFIFASIQGLLILRFLLQLSGANQTAGFVQFIYALSGVFMAPFRFIFPAVQSGRFVVDWSILVAMLAYAILYYLLRRILAVLYTADETK